MSELTAPQVARPRRALSEILTGETWAALAIGAIWMAVLFTAVFAPDFVSSDAGGNTTRIPSVIPVAIFAWLATTAIAKFAFARRQ